MIFFLSAGNVGPPLPCNIVKLVDVEEMEYFATNGQGEVTTINKQRSLDCALFCCKARRKRLEHERSVGENTRRSRVSPYFLSAQNRAKSRLLYLFYDKGSLRCSPRIHRYFQNKHYFPNEQR